MKRDRSRAIPEDIPLPESDFFRRVEAAESRETPSWDLEELTDAEEIAPAEVEWDAEGQEEDEAGDEDPSAELDGGDEDEAALVDRQGPAGGAALPLAWTLGALGAGLGVFAAVAPTAAAPVTSVLAAIGATPFALCLGGLVLGAAGVVSRQVARRTATQERRLASMSRTVQALAARGSRDEEDDVVGGDADRILVALQRQDEKINNLTRATKLYGKPLIDISNQVAEVANHVNDAEAQRAAVVAEIQKLGHRFTETIDALGREFERTRDAIAERVEETVAAGKRTQGVVEEGQLEVLEAIQKGREEQRRGVSDTVDQLRQAIAALPTDRTGGGLEDIERSIGSVQRELQSLATTLSRLEARPAASSPRAVPAATPAAAPTPATPQSAPAAGDGGDGSLASRIAGERQASGKNVLGAIAKLKSMRS